MSDQEKPTLTKEDIAFFIKSFWSSLLAPPWTRDDLIELGKAVFAKVTLEKMDDKKFGQLLPSLKTMAETMAVSMSSQIDSLTKPLIETLKTVHDENRKLNSMVEELKMKLSSSYGKDAPAEPEKTENSETATTTEVKE